jgi:phage replication initiation protein
VNKAKCDYLSITAKVSPDRLLDVARTLVPGVVAGQMPRGKFQYPEGLQLARSGQIVGMVCFGAAHGRNLLSITGQGMSRATDQSMEYAAESIASMEGSKITRIDLAVDFYEGQIRYEHCEAALEGGQFKLPKARNAPQVKRYSVGKDARNYGRSLYIGVTPKQHRGYEKGLQIWGKLPEAVKAQYQPQDMTVHADWGCPDGTATDLWFRSEVQYNDGDRLLPPEMLVRRDDFYAGSYPFCAQVLERADGVRPSYLPSPEAATLVGQALNLRKSYGGVIHAIRYLRPDLTDTQILDMLDAQYLPPSLVLSGALTKDAARALDALFTA